LISCKEQKKKKTNIPYIGLSRPEIFNLYVLLYVLLLFLQHGEIVISYHHDLTLSFILHLFYLSRQVALTVQMFVKYRYCHLPKYSFFWYPCHMLPVELW